MIINWGITALQKSRLVRHGLGDVHASKHVNMSSLQRSIIDQASLEDGLLTIGLACRHFNGVDL